MELTLYGVNIWAAALLFARMSAMIMLLPGIGEAMVPARARLGFALMLAALMAPTLAERMPAMPDSAWAMFGLLFTESVIGIIFGGAARILVTALATAGQIIGLETGIAFAQTTDPTQGQAAQIFSVFLGLMGVALMFATGLHHMFIAGIAGTYDIVAPGAPAPIDDATAMAVEAVAASFRVGFQISMPIIAAGLVFRAGLGVLSRLIPQIQAYFVILPLQIMGGFLIVGLGLSTGMLVWLDSLERYATWLR